MGNKYLPLLKSIFRKLETLNAQKELMTIGELARYLQVSTSYLYKLTSQRKIPFYQPVKKPLYFRRSEIDEWIYSHRKPPLAEMASKLSKRSDK